MSHERYGVPLKYGLAFFIDMILVWIVTILLYDFSEYKDVILVIPVGIIYFGVLGKKTLGSTIFLRGESNVGDLRDRDN